LTTPIYKKAGSNPAAVTRNTIIIEREAFLLPSFHFKKGSVVMN